MTFGEAFAYVRKRCSELGMSYDDIVGSGRRIDMVETRRKIIRELVLERVRHSVISRALGRSTPEWVANELAAPPRATSYGSVDSYWYKRRPAVRDGSRARKPLPPCACGDESTSVRETDSGDIAVCGPCLIRSLKSPQNWVRQ